MKEKFKLRILSILLLVTLLVSEIPAEALAALEEMPAATGKVVPPNEGTPDPVRYVNPLIGTQQFSGSEWAGLAPFVTAPFGMTNFTPQTRENAISDISYRYQDSRISGFMASHQPAIWMGDYGYVNMMPGVGSVKTKLSDRRLSFSHDTDEESTPYYYSVKMDTGSGKKIQTELTATERCAIFNITYPVGETPNLIVEASRNRGSGYAAVDGDSNEIYGWNNDNMSSHLNNTPPKNLKGYFVYQFSEPFTDQGLYINYNLADGDVVEGQGAGAWAKFAGSDTQTVTVQVKIGTSFLSVEQARKNLQQEIPDWDFGNVKDSLYNTWNEKLKQIDIYGPETQKFEDERYIFYTGMYHSMLFPRKFYEETENGNMYYSPYDDQVHEGVSYTDFSIWDTFRAENSFLTLIMPEQIDDMVQSLLQNYQEGGYMPKWPNPYYTNIMIGTHADSIVAEAIRKGFDGFDYNLAYDAVYKDAMVPPENDLNRTWGDRATGVPYEARAGLTYYKALGYLPNGKTSENISRTLEGAYDDWCVAQVAKAVGKDDDYEFFVNRSQNYKNIFHPELKVPYGRDINGNWTNVGAQYTEGGTDQYNYCVMQDPQGLINTMGLDFYNSNLERIFNNGVKHDNEPSHHYAYMFNYSGKPYSTQYWVRDTLLKSYSNDMAGMTGNDDCGQMSAWYIFSALGFYPVNPASGDYMIGSPIFDKAVITNPKHNTQFTITTDNNQTTGNCYIQSAALNGEPLNKPVLTYEDIVNGGDIHFVMGSTASEWGTDYKVQDLHQYRNAVNPEDDYTPVIGDSSVAFHIVNKAPLAAVDATAYGAPSGDINVPGISLVDGKYNVGYYVSKADWETHNPNYYITLDWEEPQSFNQISLWANYPKSQGPTNLDIEITKDGSTWDSVVENYTPAWATNGDSAEECGIRFDKVFDVTGVRIRINSFNNSWSKMALREVEVFDIPAIDKANLTDIRFKVTPLMNKLESIWVNGEEIEKNSLWMEEGNNVVNIKGEAFHNARSNTEAQIRFVFNAGKDCLMYVPVDYTDGMVDLPNGFERYEGEASDDWSAEGLVNEDEYLTGIYDGSWIKYEDLAFGTYGSGAMEIRYAGNKEECAFDARMEVRIGSPEGKLVGTVFLPSAENDWNQYETRQVLLREGKQLIGVKDVYLVFRGTTNDSKPYICNFDYFKILPVSRYGRLEAEGYDKWSGGSLNVETSTDMNGKSLVNIGNISYDKAWITYENTFFTDAGVEKIRVRYSGATSCCSNARIEMRKGDVDGELITTIAIPPTGGWQNYTIVEQALPELYTGSDDICFVLRKDTNSYVCNLDYIEVLEKVDTSLLQADYNQLKDLLAKEDEYSIESFYAFKEAMELTEELLKADEVAQSDVRLMQADLLDAYIGLVNLNLEKLCKELEAILEEINTLNAMDYTEESWARVTIKKDNAEKVLASATVESIRDVELALYDLKAVVLAIEKFIKADKTSLKNLYKRCQTLNITDYSAESWSPFAEAMDQVGALLADEQAATDAVAKVETTLLKLLGDLENIDGTDGVDKLVLQFQFKAFRLMQDKGYTTDSWTSFQNVLNQAAAVLDDAEATQKMVNRAVKELGKAKSGLTYAANKTPLQNVYEEFKDLLNTGYTEESWLNLQNALEEARLILEKTSAGQQEAKEAINALLMTIEELEFAVDTTILVKLIEEAKNLNVGEYTAKSFAKVVEALIEAALVDRNDQAAVDASAKVLEDTMKGLVKNPTVPDVNLDDLNSAVQAATELDTGLYTPDSYAEVAKALADAVLADKNKQEDVDAAAEALNNAINGLVRISTADLTELNEAVTRAKDLDADRYTSESYKKVVGALTKAISVDRIDQTAVDNAASELNTAIDGLVEKLVIPVINLAKLNEAVNEARELKADVYTSESYQSVINALADAAAVDKTNQTAIDEAASALKDAIRDLVPKTMEPVNLTKLNEAVNKAKALDVGKYTAESYAKVVEALAKAVNAARGGQDVVDKATKEINDAIIALKSVTPTITLKVPTIKSAKSTSKGKVRVTLKKKVANAKGYQICVSNKRTGKYKVVKTVKKATKLKINLKKLKSGKTIYIKARAYRISGGKKVYGKYSKARRVKVK